MIRLCKLSKAVISRIEKKVDCINGVKINVSQVITRKGSSAYFESTLAEREECHAVLRQFEEQGAIECEWLKQGNDSFKLLSRINIKNTQLLFELTGSVPVSSIISKSFAAISSRLIGVHWIDAELNNIIDGWKNGKKPNGFSYENIEPLLIAIEFAKEIEINGVQSRDMRTISHRIYGNSKTLERNMGPISRLYLSKLAECAGWSNADKLSYLGISKFPSIIYVKGQVELKLVNECTLLCNIPPFTAISKDSINTLTISPSVRYVLTIENLATYQRYVREVEDDGGTIVYTGGFPGRDLQDFIKLLDAKASADVMFYHWGDIDIAGFQIANVLAKLTIEHRLQLFRMSIDDALSVQGSENDYLDKEQLDKCSLNFESDIKNTVMIITQSLDDIRMVEQEAFDIMSSPLVFGLALV